MVAFHVASMVDGPAWPGGSPSFRAHPSNGPAAPAQLILAEPCRSAVSLDYGDLIQSLGDGARFLRLRSISGEGIVSKRAASRYRSGPLRSWLKTKNMVESEFIFLGTELKQRALGAAGIKSWPA
jgi:hypothetical protein